MINNTEQLGVNNESLQPWQKHMTYGSERFADATSNNHNVILFTDTDHVSKLVLGKDAALVMPANPDNLNIWSGYPTHQESWLPMWFITQYHSQHRTPKEKQYREQVATRVTPADRALMQKALLYKAEQFWTAYKETPADIPPKKKYKNITRIVQDILLYMDMPEIVPDKQEEFLANHPLAGLITQANMLRRGENLETAPALEAMMERAIDEYKTLYGADEELAEAFRLARERITEESKDNNVILYPDKSIQNIQAENIAELLSGGSLLPHEK